MFAPAKTACSGAQDAALAAGRSPAASSPAAVAEGTSSLADRPCASFRLELLDLAFEAATAMPRAPHLKNRSRAQEAVVVACLELDQPRRALAYAERIENWRRGVGFADVAAYCAEHGLPDDAERLLARARQVCDEPGDANDQEWRKERILEKVARTSARLEQERRRAPSGSEPGSAPAATPPAESGAESDRQLEALERVLATGGFDAVRGALAACAAIYDRVYDERERRARVEAAIRGAWTRVPVTVRIDVAIALARAAVGHVDRDAARALLEEASFVVDGADWLPEHVIPIRARLAEARALAGETTEARHDVDCALALFDAERPRIVDIRRAGVLCVLAEAYASLGDPAAALAAYRRAVEEGVHNPNSRPRAEDLGATCRSMALRAIEPDAALWARMRRIREELSPPW
jgi:hypothetical protein